MGQSSCLFAFGVKKVMKERKRGEKREGKENEPNLRSTNLNNFN